MDWKKVSEELRKYTNLASSPISVRMLERASELGKTNGLRQLQDTAPCHMAAWARYYGPEGIVGASAAGVKCVWGAACCGLIRSPERLSEGDLAWRYAKDAKAGKHIQEAMGVLGETEKRFNALAMSPLGLTPFDPEVIVMYVTPAQALRLVVAYAFAEGEDVFSRITGQSSLCSSIANAVSGKTMVIDIPCVGDRMFGLVQEQEMIVAFHETRAGQIVEGLKDTEEFSSHPFRPFLRWPVIFAPDMEPRRTELD